MKLYYGSNVEVNNPKIIPPKRKLDFGTGFYLTSDFNQAERWAKQTAKLKGGIPIVNIYEFDEKSIQNMNVKKFEFPNEEWLDFVSLNRIEDVNSDFDIIIGPVADDQVIRTVNLYVKGDYSSKIAIELLLPFKLTDQYTFKTERSLKLLTYLEKKIYD